MRNAPVDEYVSAAVYSADQRAIFERSWQLIGPAVAPGCAGQLRRRGDRRLRRSGDPIVPMACCVRFATCVGTAALDCCLKARQLPRLHPVPVPPLAVRRHWRAASHAMVRRRPDVQHRRLAARSRSAIDEWRGLVFVAIDPIEPLARTTRRADCGTRRRAVRDLLAAPRGADDVRRQLEDLRRQLHRGLPHPRHPPRLLPGDRVRQVRDDGRATVTCT